MNTKYTTTLIILSLLTTISGCKRGEALQLGAPIEMNRFTLPQGNSSIDKEILSLSKKYDSYIIYKGFEGSDIAKSWIAPSSGTVYITTPVGDEGLEEMYGIFKSSILESLTEELSKKALPLYVYLCDTLMSAQQSVNEEGETILSNKRDIPYSFSGQDYWAFCLSPSDRQDESKRLTYSCQLKLNLFNKLENNGHITVPEEFESLSDYDTPTNSYTPSDPNYYKKRGFIDILRDSFSGRTQRFMLYLAKRGRNADFLMFVKALIYYTPEEFENKYPKEEYPLIHEKLDYVHKALVAQGLDISRK